MGKAGFLQQWQKSAIFLVAGPCSAESEEQVLATASALADSGVAAFRAGIWKPRTKPGGFEGVGAPGLQWLRRAKQETGLPTIVEVAQPDHVEACMEAGIDMFWIGARTTANPFSVQALADALQGIDVPVFVKNPVSPDLNLWIGALERVERAGIKHLAAIHRGFSSREVQRYRNAPFWRLPIELMRRLPDLPLLCDPSHIAGKADYIAELSQKALDLLFHGLMIEVHPAPASALSDSAQQLTPEQLLHVLHCLKLKHDDVIDPDFHHKLHDLRENIDDLDTQLVETLARRMRLSSEIGELKRKYEVTSLQPSRWQEILERRIQAGEGHGMSREFMKGLLELIHEESLRQQLNGSPQCNGIDGIDGIASDDH